MTDTITVDQFLAHPPTTVWRALTDSDLLARWLMPNNFAPIVGHHFTFRTEPQPAYGFDGLVRCQVLELDPDHRMRWSWRGGRLDTTVTWTLVVEGRGTRLFLEHAGFDPDDPAQRQTLTILRGGWRSHVLPALAAIIDTLSGD
jgi:uncharacterized protein YndB with AHSA1/START domain